MSCSFDPDCLPLISSIPGPRGPGGAGASDGASGAAGRPAYGVLTAPFVMPAAAGTVTIVLDHTEWCAVGQSLFIESAGYFLVATIVSAVSLTVTAQNVPSNTAAGVTIPAGKRVVAGGLPLIDETALSNLGDRVYQLETSPGGNSTLYANHAPTGAGLKVGDLWFDTAHGNRPYRWDGSGWVDMSDARVGGLVSDVSSLHTGVNQISSTADALKQEYVLAVVGSGSDRRVAGFRVTVPGGGASDPTEFVVQADKFVILGPDGTGRDSPFYIEDGKTYIKAAVIPQLEAGKINVGDLAAVNIGHAGRLYHAEDPNGTKHYFHAVEFATASGNNHNFGSASTSFGFTHCDPATGYAPLAPGWDGATKPTACPDAAGRVRVQAQGRLIGYTGNILLYCQIGSRPYEVLAARASADSGNAVIDTTRILTGVLKTDTVRLFVAPADGNGNISAAAPMRYEIDATFFNW